MNYPYKGKSDGLIKALRAQFSDEQYLGVELETNQQHYSDQGVCQTELVSTLVSGLKQLLSTWAPELRE